MKKVFDEFCLTLASEPVATYVWGILTGVAFAVLAWAIINIVGE